MAFFHFISFSKSFFLFFSATVIATCHSSQDLLPVQHQQCIHEHFSALLDLKTGLNFSYYIGPDYHHSKSKLSSWNPEDRDCCSWKGIACDKATGHVTSVYLSRLHISGKINFGSLGRIRSLQILDLASNQFVPSRIPSAIGELTSLTHLNLSNSKFYGQVPLEMSSLTRLVSLDLSFNGYYKDDSNFIPLKLEKPSIGAFIQNLSSLRELHLDTVNMSVRGSQWSQAIPSALPNLRKLSMSNCRLSGVIHPISQLRFLSELNLDHNNFSPVVLESIGNLSSVKSLTTLSLRNCSISGSIPSGLTNLTKLKYLDLSQNSLNGIIPSSLFTHPSLRSLELWSNQLGGQLSEFPNSSSSPLETINLSDNELQGMIPRSIFELRKLSFLVLNLNNFSGVLDLHIFKNLTDLSYLDLSNNELEGSLPIPPPSITAVMVSFNRFSGEIPMSICNASSLNTFEIDYNNFSGHIPQCFGEMSNSLIELDFGGNSLSGNFFQAFKENCSLEKLDLRDNQLEGELPVSLANCKKLTILNLGNNQIQDTFPLWVEGLTYLRIFILRSNHFYGPIQPPPTCQNFLKLQIVDLSFNNFNGSLPPTMFCGWKRMTGEDNSKPEYLKIVIKSYAHYYEEVTIRIKRLEMDDVKISTANTIIDLSRNYFQGPIPESIGALKSLWILNMSHNDFTGQIPASLKNLRALESLDLSHNHLSGNIPPDLLELTFLSVLDLSENQLTGSIPQAKQFSTFTNESFQGNPGLCGLPLSELCGDTNGTPSSTSNVEELFPESEYNWKTIALGFGVGYGVGVGAFCWTLVLWTKGRRAYNKFVYRMLLLFLPSMV